MKIYKTLALISQEIRISHWLKNFLVFAPLLVSGLFASKEKTLSVVYLFFTFCLLASMVYIFNDIADLKKDRNHPVKKHRPIASKQISISAALFTAALLAIGTIFLSQLLNPGTQLILATYLIINILYSLYLKNIILLDIATVTIFYILRLLAGGAILSIEISGLLMLTTIFLSLFLIVAKRRTEHLNNNPGNSSRPVLLKYSKTFLDSALYISIAGVILSYSLYAIESAIEKEMPQLIYSVIFVIFGVIRYFFLAKTSDKTETPEKIIFQDFWIFLSVFAWLMYTLLVIFLNTKF